MMGSSKYDFLLYAGRTESNSNAWKYVKPVREINNAKCITKTKNSRWRRNSMGFHKKRWLIET